MHELGDWGTVLAMRRIRGLLSHSPLHSEDP
jgi:hypothetical protein